jgi:hypothetical protein
MIGSTVDNETKPHTIVPAIITAPKSQLDSNVGNTVALDEQSSSGPDDQVGLPRNVIAN